MKYLIIALVSITLTLAAQSGPSCGSCSGGGCSGSFTQPGPETGISCVSAITVTPEGAGIQIYSVIDERESSKITVNFALQENASIALGLQDMEGGSLALIADGFYESGNHMASFSTDSLEPGMYVVELSALEATARAVIYILG
ncbi:MAG: hypothetical protein GF388_10895 [Candidatus Aegiribacteria sp.]|nr:hypothetical protein [Candidatus Aegiribacteria sp.]MBD3295514.1 hypothetical protein [Candidatus Fermentibacteria bacterium]